MGCLSAAHFIKINLLLNYFIEMKTKLFIFLISFFFLSCDQKLNLININGNISNLPDGTIYLSNDIYNNIIDSTLTKNGIFVFKQNNSNLLEEPIYLGLSHKDKQGIKRLFSFPTYANYKKSGYNSSYFLSDSTISIIGNFKDNTPNGLGISEKVKLITCPEIEGGYQTNAMFHIDGDLFENINLATFGKVLSKIKEYPNSFHLLYQINKNRNSFKPMQIHLFLNSFNGKIKESKTFKILKNYNDKRFENNKISVTQLANNKGEKTDILDNNYKKHLVVFWASWCGPCRQEIPSLKKMYSKYKNSIEFVSISIDEKYSLWQKALYKEQMSWKQLIINEESKEFETIEIFFQLSPSIPYIALVDNNMKVIKSHVGLINEIELEIFLKD
jgi:thiol-disulfide isomerase/thioredoxin